MQGRVNFTTLRLPLLGKCGETVGKGKIVEFPDSKVECFLIAITDPGQ